MVLLIGRSFPGEGGTAEEQRGKGSRHFSLLEIFDNFWRDQGKKKIGQPLQKVERF